MSRFWRLRQGDIAPGVHRERAAAYVFASEPGGIAVGPWGSGRGRQEHREHGHRRQGKGQKAEGRGCWWRSRRRGVSAACTARHVLALHSLRACVRSTPPLTPRGLAQGHAGQEEEEASTAQEASRKEKRKSAVAQCRAALFWAGDEDARGQEGEGSKTPSKGGPSEQNQDKVRMRLPCVHTPMCTCGPNSSLG